MAFYVWNLTNVLVYSTYFWIHRLCKHVYCLRPFWQFLLYSVIVFLETEILFVSELIGEHSPYLNAPCTKLQYNLICATVEVVVYAGGGGFTNYTVT